MLSVQRWLAHRNAQPDARRKSARRRGSVCVPNVLRLESYTPEQTNSSAPVIPSPMQAASSSGSLSTGFYRFWQSVQTAVYDYSQWALPQASLSSPTVKVAASNTASKSAVTAAAYSVETIPRIDEFLELSSRLEVETCSILADLSNMAYSVQNITGSRLANMHNLELVTTSLACASVLPTALPKLKAKGKGQSLEEIVAEQLSADTAVASNIVPIHRNREGQVGNDGDRSPSASASLDDPVGMSERRAVQTLFKHTVKSIYNITATIEEELDEEAAKEFVRNIGYSQSESKAKSSTPEPSSCNPTPPAAWFVADNVNTHCRHIVIQGSTSLEHWQINLQFEPVIFEHRHLGVRIHRGVYEAALKLYDDLLPLVQEHLDTSPFATICFSGHSLGGSLATVLMLLFVIRGVLPATAVAPVYTFGAAAVFCQGGNNNSVAERCKNCDLACDSVGHMHDSQPRGLLQSLGLIEDHVVNVVMHNDIVPRAFVCDYTLVADIIQRWWPSFKEHSGLERRHQHKVLYNFVGRIAILQPDPSLPFVVGDGRHAMLPEAAALYKMQDPRRGQICKPKDRSHTEGKASSSPPTKPTSLQDAFLMFMNSPHPLTLLSTAAAYGAQGMVSRYHNPDNYTKGLVSLLKTAAHV